RRFQMWRDVDPREPERERPEPGRAGTGSSQTEFAGASGGLPGVFSRDLGVPRGPHRERLRVDAHAYKLSGDDVRALATVGAFRVVPANELRAPNPMTPTRPAQDLERLRDQGLIKTMPHVVGRTRTTVVTLTERGRALLESRRRGDSIEARQAFYSGISK